MCSLLTGAWSLPDASGRATKRTWRVVLTWGCPNLHRIAVLPRPQSSPPVPTCSHVYRPPHMVRHLAALHTAPTGSVSHIPVTPPPGCSLAPVTTMVPSARKRRSTSTFQEQNLSLLAEPHMPCLWGQRTVSNLCGASLAGCSFAGPRWMLLGGRSPVATFFLLDHMPSLSCQHLRACLRCYYTVPPDLERPRPSRAASGPLSRCADSAPWPLWTLEGVSLCCEPTAAQGPCGPEPDGLARPCRLGTRPASAAELLRAPRRPLALSRGSNGGQVMPGVWDRSEESRCDGLGGLSGMGCLHGYVGDRAAP